MRKLLLPLFACAFSIPLQAQQWPAVRPEAKPGLRWWWLGSAVDKPNLQWSLRQYADHGVGAVEITPIYGVQNNETNNIDYLSDKWMEMLRYTQQQGAADCIEIDMATGTGWPFGGPWVPLEESASQMVIVDKQLDGHKLKSLDLAPPAKKASNCRLAGVFAFSGDTFVNITKGLENGVFKLNVQQKTGSISSLSVDGKLPHKGNWRIIALYQKYGVMRVKRAAPGGAGLVIDHFDKQAVSHYLKHIEQAFERTHAPYPHTFFNDSYEVSEADYTTRLFPEFECRRGYSLEENFDKLVDGDAKVVADYRETLGDLLLENFTQTWTAWAHSHGAVTRNQAHGSPANLIDCYSAVDIPEIEGFGLSDFGIKGLRTDSGFTRKNDSDFSMYKWASSAAHINGKPFTSSETFTWLTEHFRTSLSQMKPDMDLMFVGGVNHMYFHGTAYTPKDDPWPGWKFYASVDMSPTNTIWRDAPYLMRYITRCQSFLQWGKPDNDFLVFVPVRDLWHKQAKGKRLMQFAIHTMGQQAPEFAQTINDIDRLGFDCDYISERYLLQTCFVDGMLQTAAGSRYKALILPGKDNLLSDTVARHIETLRKQGAVIIIGADAKLMSETSHAEAMKTDHSLRLIRRSNDLGYHYFISNLSDHDVNAMTTLAVPFSEALWFDPMTGQRYAATISKASIHVCLRSGESMILQTFNGTSAELHQQLAGFPLRSSIPVANTRKVLDKGWTLSFKDCTPAYARVLNIDSLSTWENLNDTLRTLMGTGVYECQLKLSKADFKHGSRWELDLGDVRESARVFVNDSLIGCAWAAPFTLQFDNVLTPGINHIRIEVTNLPANRIAQLDREGYKWRKMEEINVVDIHYQTTSYSGWSPVASGLNGTVALYRVQ